MKWYCCWSNLSWYSEKTRGRRGQAVALPAAAAQLLETGLGLGRLALPTSRCSYLAYPRLTQVQEKASGLVVVEEALNRWEGHIE